MSAKELVLDLVQQMPEESTLSDILYELYVRHEIEEGLRDIDEGRTIPHEEVMKRLERWFS
jgi:predicted transcriptional regulator